MKILRPVNELTTHIVIPASDLVQDHQKRYYAIPKDYRPDGNPFEEEPLRYNHDLEKHPEYKTYFEALDLMNVLYWKILADEAERCYKENA